MRKNRVIALILRLAIFTITLIGLLINFGVFRGRFIWGATMFYTIQSNLLVLVLFGVLVISTLRDIFRKQYRGNSSYFPKFQFICTVDVLLTFAVYWILLAPGPFSMTEETSLFSLGNLSVHLIAPLGCVLDFIFFTRSKFLKYSNVYLVLVFPFIYLCFASLAGLVGYTYRISPIDGQPIHYPYPFMDYDRTGIGVIIYIFIIMIALLITGHIFYLFYRNSKSSQKRIKKYSSSR